MRAIASGPAFAISEIQLSRTQTVPWHTHTNVSDTFYVLEGTMRLFLQNPKEAIELAPGEIYQVAPGRPHLVTNAGERSITFLVLRAQIRLRADGVRRRDATPRTPRRSARRRG